ncbi:hypothetical protein GCM10018771_67670 [Streptomyces cellulosae]|nr:hypothetical protein GCM10018771_67670 [Streptomyces cellulosae]
MGQQEQSTGFEQIDNSLAGKPKPAVAAQVVKQFGTENEIELSLETLVEDVAGSERDIKVLLSGALRRPPERREMSRPTTSAAG